VDQKGDVLISSHRWGLLLHIAETLNGGNLAPLLSSAMVATRSAPRSCRFRGFFNLQAGGPRRRTFHDSVMTLHRHAFAKWSRPRRR
jgi:hypothetical protein